MGPSLDRMSALGASLLANGVTFRVWAPRCRSVDVVVDGRAIEALVPREGGLFEVTLEGLAEGARYKYRLDATRYRPDPASRFQPEGVHGPSVVVDPNRFVWTDQEFAGHALGDLVLYELHVGAFTPPGTFEAIVPHLARLVELGVTAVELMPIAEFPGSRNWGYDGVHLWAPQSTYGGPRGLRRLVDACHARGLAVFLDVVYNHFGPEGNYLGRYAPEFFDRRHRTPWGDAINFDGPGSEVVRSFVVHNALYWLEEFHLDGLRLDAVQAIADSSAPHVLGELARAVAEGPGRDRLVHLVLENDGNESRYLARAGEDKRPLYQAQWNDDLHHALHTLLTGERDGYYADYQPPLPHLARALGEGFAFQGEWSPYRGRVRGESSAALPPTAFVGFLQNHDQIGNRALGERITALAPAEAVRAATAVLLLAPPLPLLFMGQEWAAPEPFLFFSELGGDFGAAVSDGRRREFARFPEFAGPRARMRIPDPQDERTFARSVLDWRRTARTPGREWIDFHRTLLDVRSRDIMPLLSGEPVPETRWALLAETALEATWTFPEQRVLRLIANLGAAPVRHGGPQPDWGRAIYALGPGGPAWTELVPWSVYWYVSEASR